jgi:hypothetical protein
MAEIALAILEPNGKRWAQLLEDQIPIGDLIVILVDRLELPKELNYQLIPSETGSPLDKKITLGTAGIIAGAELMLKPIPDLIFAKLRDKLYKEMKKQAEKKLMEEAKSLYEKLGRLDPEHPDPDGLGRRIKNSTSGVESVMRKAPEVQETPGSRAEPPKQGKRTKARSKSGSRLGCGAITVLGVGAILVVVVVAVYLVLTETDLGFPNLGSDQDPTQVTLGTGDVQVTLRWGNAADIDLHVTDPFGEEIWFNHRSSGSGGELDVDANANCNERRAEPVENVYWPVGLAPAGEYLIYVNYFEDCGNDGPTSIEVVIKIDQEVVGTYSDFIYPEDDPVFITSFFR